MIIEATVKLQLEPKAVLRHLNNHPLDVKKLIGHQSVYEKIQAMGVKILPFEADDVLGSNEIKILLWGRERDIIR